MLATVHDSGGVGMTCPRCTRDNAAAARFCRECGTALLLRCSQCHGAVAAAARYCTECGAAQRPESPITAVAAPERRHASVVFCDVAESTGIAAQLDPEEFRAVMRAFRQVVAEAVRAHDGTVAQYVGDGVVAYFGIPHAHEDAACRAVRAGLEMLARLAQANEDLERRHGVRLHVRVSAHSGVVVLDEAGDGTTPSHGAIGETMHLASRLCGEAEPGELLVSEATRRLLRDAFELVALGPLALRGFPQPVLAFRVMAARDQRRLLAMPARARLTPFVDREAEMALLLARWADARAGRGQVVLVGGEAGIGKSRLVQTFQERLAAEPALVFATECSPYHRTTPLHPILDVLTRALDLGTTDSAVDRLTQVETVFAPYLAGVPNGIALLAALLGIDGASRHVLPAMSPQRQRRETLEVLLTLMFATARIEPVLIVVDDLHWADPSTLELLATFVEQTANARQLTLLVHRPDFVPPWRRHAHVTPLALGPMPTTALQHVVRGSVEAGALEPPVVVAVAERAEGNPLLAEELARMMAERGRGVDRDVADGIPPTLRDWLAARLDRLGEAKLIAQVAATIGRTFTYRVLRAIAPVEESVLLAALERLTAAELIQPRGLPPRATYTFKHVLIQEAAYESLLHSERRRYHRAVAEVLEATPGDDAPPELLAHHYGEAGCVTAAIDCWQRAASQAVARSANAEAVAHLRRGLELAARIADPSARGAHELTLLASLAMPLALRQGYAAPEVEAVFVRARDLALQLGNLPYLFGIVRGMLGLYDVSGRYARAASCAEELQRLADASGESGWAVEAAWERGSVALFTGHLAEARAHCERALALYDPAVHRMNATIFGEDPGMMAHVHASLACWASGDPNAAVRHIESGIRLGESVQHPNSIAMAQCFAAAIHQTRGDVDHTIVHGELALRLALEHELPLWIGCANVYLGWASARRGDAVVGIELMRAGLAQWRATGAQEALPAFCALLAEELLARGRTDEAAAVLEDAHAIASRNGERFYEPELHRLSAELLRAQGAPAADVDRRFDEAIELADACGANAMLLRAALGLGRFRAAQGRASAGRDLVARALTAVRDALDTQDGRDARAFLDGATVSPTQPSP